MNDVLVHIEFEGGELSMASKKLLTHCSRISEAGNALLAAIAMGPMPSSDAIFPRDLAVDRLFVAETMQSDAPSLAHHVQALEAAWRAFEPSILAVNAHAADAEAIGFLAGRIGAGFVPDALQFEAGTDGVSAICLGSDGRSVHAVQEPYPVILSVIPGAVGGDEQDRASPAGEEESGRFSTREMLRLDQSVAGAARLLERQSHTAPPSNPLSEARIVVGAGGGVATPEARRLVEELAARLGAAVGTTRAGVETGCFPEEWKIGQSGRTVAPVLYVAIGISGATQHLAGIRGSTIVAVNSDAAAPIVDEATFVLIGDLNEILPRLIDELARRGY